WNIQRWELRSHKGTNGELGNKILSSRKDSRASSMSQHGSGSNALGLFHEFINDEDVRLIGVEAAGFELNSGKHAATLTR
ncbi:hypothetical protein Gorai_008046, partial [Gossypium raimondii]|nr:hypothetical protein [Gossypium raimondii]